MSFRNYQYAGPDPICLPQPFARGTLQLRLRAGSTFLADQSINVPLNPDIQEKTNWYIVSLQHVGTLGTGIEAGALRCRFQIGAGSFLRQFNLTLFAGSELRFVIPAGSIRIDFEDIFTNPVTPVYTALPCNLSYEVSPTSVPQRAKLPNIVCYESVAAAAAPTAFANFLGQLPEFSPYANDAEVMVGPLPGGANTFDLYGLRKETGDNAFNSTFCNRITPVTMNIVPGFIATSGSIDIRGGLYRQPAYTMTGLNVFAKVIEWIYIL